MIFSWKLLLVSYLLSYFTVGLENALRHKRLKNATETFKQTLPHVIIIYIVLVCLYY